MERHQKSDLFYPVVYTDGLYKKICRRLDRICLALVGLSPFREVLASKAKEVTKGLDVLTNIDKDKRYTLSAVAMVRDEQDYLREWIEFHRIVGFEHFFIYDNSENDKSFEILKGYIECGIVSYVRFPDLGFGRKKFTDHHKLSKQELAYGDCINRFSSYLNWLMQIDLDEFCYPTVASGTDDLKSVLMGYQEKGYWGVEVNMLDFGSSWHKEKPVGLMIENFHYCNEKMRADVKSFARVAKLKKNYYSRVHNFIHKYQLFSNTLRLKVLSGDVVNKDIRLNHYVTKSLDEFMEKTRRNRVAQKGKYTEEKFNEVVRVLNSRKDNGEILRFTAQLKSRMADN